MYYLLLEIKDPTQCFTHVNQLITVTNQKWSNHVNSIISTTEKYVHNFNSHIITNSECDVWWSLQHYINTTTMGSRPVQTLLSPAANLWGYNYTIHYYIRYTISTPQFRWVTQYQRGQDSIARPFTIQIHAPWQRDMRLTLQPTYTTHVGGCIRQRTQADSLAQCLQHQTEQDEGGMCLLLWEPSEKPSLLQTSLDLQREIKHWMISQSNIRSTETRL